MLQYTTTFHNEGCFWHQRRQLAFNRVPSVCEQAGRQAGRQAGLLHKAECFAAMHIGGAALPTMRSFTGLARVIDGFIIICYLVVFKKAATRVQNGFCVKGCLLYLSISTNISEYLGSYPVWCHNVTLLACVNLFAVQ